MSVITYIIAGLCLYMHVSGIGVTFGPGPWFGFLGYHFSHANLFHMVLNMWALVAFRPRAGTCAVAFLCASLCALIPWCSATLPTCGLSAFLFACFARKTVAWKESPVKYIVPQLALMILPGVNWMIHVASYVSAYVIWYGIYRRRAVNIRREQAAA